MQYRPIRRGEEEAVSDLVVASFWEFVGHEYSAEGVEEFLRYAHPEALVRRDASCHRILVAASGAELVGTIEFRNNEHLSMLFVDERFHRRGIASELFRRSLELARRARPDLVRITVYSSRHAVPFYKKLGFKASGAERTVNGLVFVPMERGLTGAGA